jgi:hypothetical protein
MREAVRKALLSRERGGWIVAAGLTCAVAGLTNGGTSAAADFSSSASSLWATATS